MKENAPMTPAPLEEITVPNIVPFDNIEVENITPINSQMELQDVTTTQDHVVSPEINETIETNFTITPATAALQDPKIAIEKRKQMRLLNESLGQTSFHTIRILFLAGILPRDLTNVAPPLCPGCSYGKSNQRTWHQKGNRNLKNIKPVTIPGQVVITDQLVIYNPGLIPTHQGIPTTKRYSGATIFFDHASDFTCVHLMEGNTYAAKKVESPQAFERIAKSHRVTINQYNT